MSDTYKSIYTQASRRQRQEPARDKSSNSINNLLAYYESPSADGQHSATESPILAPRPRRRTLSAGSTSSSDYSEASDSVDEPFSDFDHASVSSTSKKRSAMPSQGGADRRRLAIVQMETLQEAMASDTASSASSSIRSRRGLSSQLAGLALVAPPDASSRTYTHLTPPTTATPGRTEEKRGHVQPSPRSEKASPRDTETDDTEPHKDNDKTPSAKMGRTTTLPPTQPLRPSLAARSAHPYEAQRAMLSPVSALDRHTSSARSSAFPSPIVTPEIGASKEIHIPVAAPVVVDLGSRRAIQSRQPTSAQPLSVGTKPTRAETAPSVPSTKSTTPFDPVETSGFVDYQPGLHAIAGPLPPPPRLFDLELRTPPPPRPPRLHSPAPPKMKLDLEATKQALQLPPSVAAKLSKTPTDIKSPAVTSKREESVPGDTADTSTTLTSTVSSHRREGAFPSSPLVRTPDLASSAPSSASTSSLEPARTRQPSVVDDEDDHVPNVTIEEEAPQPNEEDEPGVTASGIGHLAEDTSLKASTSTSSSVSSAYSNTKSMRGDRSSWVSAKSFGKRTPSPHSSHRRVLSEEEGNSPSSKRLSRSSSLSPRSSKNDAPSPPPKSFRNSLTTGLKRFSTLPRAPSLSASVGSRHSKRSSSGTHHSSRTPSPSITHTRNVRKKIVDYNPPAMFCHEVYQQRTTAERCAIYVAKINELYIYDCGLSDWVLEMKYRTSNPAPRGPSAQPFVPKPRITSRSSMVSEATFPRRPDAVVATDLSQGASSFGDAASPISIPVSLPYQSLADRQRQQSIRSNSSAGHSTPPSSVRSLAAPSSNGHGSNKTGFFASLGRKASLNTGSRRERASQGGLTPNGTNSRNVLSKAPPSKQDISKPILIQNNHSAPSGPRALVPRSSMRVQRSQTLMTTVTPAYPVDKDAMGRRPSLFNIPSSLEVGAPEVSAPYVVDAEFEEQVNKLQNLLPHADRGVLAGYLRRSGQDVLAIGQYLEDEKNGTLKYF